MPDIETLKEYRIKRLSRHRLKHLALLYEAVYQKKIDPSFYEKKYNTGYTGVTYLGFIAYNDSGNPIAFYGVQPCFIQYKEQIILAAQSGDTMTHPDYRLHGFFVDLSKRTFDLCRQEGIRFLFGFPNQNSYHGAVKKLGWQQAYTLDCFSWKTKTIPFAAQIQKWPLLKNLYNRYLKRCLTPYLSKDQFINNTVLEEGFGGIYRTSDYFAYKTYHTLYFLSIGKAKTWIKISGILEIGDLELNGEDLEIVINKLKRIGMLIGCKRLFFHASPGTQIHNKLGQLANSAPSFAALFQDLGTDLPFHQIKFTFADIDIF